MLQIIGWLLCVYLVVKGCELLAMKHTAAYIGTVIAFVAAPVFFVLINQQVAATNTPIDQLGSGPERYDANLEAMVEADAVATDAAVENALQAAKQAIENADAAVGE